MDTKGDLKDKYRKITATEPILSTNYILLSTNITERLECRLTEKWKNWQIVESEKRNNNLTELQLLVEHFNENSTVPVKDCLRNLSDCDIYIAANSIGIYRKYFGTECDIYNSTDGDFCGNINFAQLGRPINNTIKMDRRNKCITPMEHAAYKNND